ncbi:molybdopterin-dependent oxidoreductase [Bacillus stercoris]|nr:molybdopterin-dependent oxidoreductase [Bacillus stercoris]
MASRAVGGQPVKLFNSREEDMITSPVHIGLDAIVKLGATKDGILKAADIQFLFDGGAYSDKGVDVSRAGVVDCTVHTRSTIYGVIHIVCIRIIHIPVHLEAIVMLKFYLPLSEQWMYWQKS